MARTLCESDVEEYILDRLENKGYSYICDLGDENSWATSRSLDEFINEDALRAQLIKINKGIIHPYFFIAIFLGFILGTLKLGKYMNYFKSEIKKCVKNVKKKKVL